MPLLGESFVPIEQGQVITADWLNRWGRNGGVVGPDTIVNGAGVFMRQAFKRTGIPFYNGTEETIPAYAVFRCNGTQTVGGTPIIKAAKSLVYGSQYNHFINGRFPVSSGKTGRCFNNWGEVPALYDSDDGTPAFGEQWGPRSGSWKLKKNTPGFRIVGRVDTDRETAVVTQNPFTKFFGHAILGCSKGFTCSVSIYYSSSGGGFGTDTLVDMEDVYAPFWDVGNLAPVEVTWHEDVYGLQWYFSDKDCLF